MLYGCTNLLTRQSNAKSLLYPWILWIFGIRFHSSLNSLQGRGCAIKLEYDMFQIDKIYTIPLQCSLIKRTSFRNPLLYLKFMSIIFTARTARSVCASAFGPLIAVAGPPLWRKILLITFQSIDFNFTFLYFLRFPNCTRLQIG